MNTVGMKIELRIRCEFAVFAIFIIRLELLGLLLIFFRDILEYSQIISLEKQFQIIEV